MNMFVIGFLLGILIGLVILLVYNLEIENKILKEQIKRSKNE